MVPIFLSLNISVNILSADSSYIYSQTEKHLREENPVIVTKIKIQRARIRVMPKYWC
jgi:hypothetical protein